MNTSACSFRRRPPSAIIPRYPKSTCTSRPGGGSVTGTVTRGRDDDENPHSAAANRASVRYGTATPRRSSSSPIFTSVRSCFTHPLMSPVTGTSNSHAAPCPAGRAGRTAATTAPSSSSVSCDSPPSRARPACCVFPVAQDEHEDDAQDEHVEPDIPGAVSTVRAHGDAVVLTVTR